MQEQVGGVQAGACGDRRGDDQGDGGLEGDDAAAIAAGAGLLAADLFLHAQFSVSLRSPGTTYYLSVIAGLLISLGAIATTLPLLNRITGPETARNE